VTVLIQHFAYHAFHQYSSADFILLMTVTVVLLFSPLGSWITQTHTDVSRLLINYMQSMAYTLTNYDAIIYSQQTRGGLESTLQTLNLTDRRFQNTRLEVIPHLAIDQVETIEHECPFGVTDGGALCGIVVCSKLGNEISRIFCGIDRQRLGDGQKSRCEFCDGELFTRAL
jgi:hypothetical protein